MADNSSTHETAMIPNWFAKRSRFHIHLLLRIGSWIVPVERWLTELTNKRICGGVFRRASDVEAAIREC